MYPESGITKGQVGRVLRRDRSLDPAAHRPPPAHARPLPRGLRRRQCFFQKHHKEGFPESVLQVPDPRGSGHGQAGRDLPRGRLDGGSALAGADERPRVPRVGLAHRDARVPRPDRVRPRPRSRTCRSRGSSTPRASCATCSRGWACGASSRRPAARACTWSRPSRRRGTWDEVKAFAHGLTQAVVKADPEHYTANMALKKRPGKIFVDYLRNGRGATYVTAYSTRRRPGAPVSTPLRWDELPRFRPGPLHGGQHPPPPVQSAKRTPGRASRTSARR